MEEGGLEGFHGNNIIVPGAEWQRSVNDAKFAFSVMRLLIQGIELVP